MKKEEDMDQEENPFSEAEHIILCKMLHYSRRNDSRTMASLQMLVIIFQFFVLFPVFPLTTSLMVLFVAQLVFMAAFTVQTGSNTHKEKISYSCDFCY